MSPLAPRVVSGRALGVVCILALLYAHQNDATLQCGPGLRTPGVTLPQGDINLKEGTPLELFCILNNQTLPHRNASHLTFYRKNERVSPEHLEVMNETTLRLYIKQPRVSESMFYCKLKKEDGSEDGVCLNSVAVGYDPQEVDNFNCVSYNWQKLRCSWTPKFNPVKTKYKIFFRLSGRAGRRKAFACPEDTDVRENFCVWNETSNPHYRQPYEYYYFTLHAENQLNTSLFQLPDFHHYAHVIPAKPDNLVLLEKTSHSARLEWHVPYPMQNFPPGLIQRVEYLPQWESPRSEWNAANASVLRWHVANTSVLNTPQNTKAPRHVFNLTDLPYANTLYDIRVYMMSTRANAAKSNDLWSAPAAITVKTLPALPGAPPKTDIGSFETLNRADSRDIYLYWQTIPEYMQNGDDFKYRVVGVEKNDRPVVMEPSEIKKKFAVFSKVDLFDSLRFRVVSVNSEGQSIEKSEIFIPPRFKVPQGPSSVTRVYYDKGIYELSWKAPERSEEIESYTLFWCDSTVDRTCTGYLDWMHIPSHTTMKNVTVQEDKSYQFAISANTHTSSSGMVWASCTILYNKPIQKMKNVFVKRVDSTSMELAWNLDCLDRNGMVNGFRIYYCPVQHKGPKCKTPPLNITQEAGTSSATLKGLRPYTTYSISIAVLSRGGEGLPSDPLLNVTLEDAPTSPQNVTVDDVTNSTITISWNAPKEKNGVITKYEVHYDNRVQTKNMDPNQNDDANASKKQKIVLENLTSYFNYSISVTACTVSCSNPSPPLTVETKVGVPGHIGIPHVTFVNASRLNVTWDPPAYPAGNLDYYEVMVKHPGIQNNTDELISTTRTSIHIPILECSERQDQPYQFFVRAVNVDPETNKALHGNWSRQGEGSCYQSGLPQPLRIIIYIVCVGLVLVALIGFICLSRRVWIKCKDMRDVEVKLPPGLVPPSEHERDQDFNLHQWSTLTHDSEASLRVRPAADEECLLQRNSKDQEPNSGESSGCSSGHDSVSSSTTSGTHLSADSGTEVDQHEQGGYPDPSWEAGSEASSLRQRNIPGRQPWEQYSCVGSSSARSTPNLTEIEPPLPGGYAVMGLHNWSSHSSIPDGGSEASPARQTTGQPQQLSRGYVALDTATSVSPAVAPPKRVKPKLDVSQAQGYVAQGYVAHPPKTDPWAHPVPVKGYVTTGEKQVSSEEEGDWDTGYSPELQRLQPNSAGYVKAGECGMRPSRTEPALGSGYVMTGDKVLNRDRHKTDRIAPALPQQTTCYIAAPPLGEQLKPSHGVEDIPVPRTHEYVMTGERELTRNPPFLMLDPDPHKAYCRISERDTPVVRPKATTTSGYVPHRQLETHSPPSVVE